VTSTGATVQIGVRSQDARVADAISWHGLWPLLLSSSLLVAGALIAGSFGEEVGCRGWAQPRLQQRRGALAAAIVVGVIWSLWHRWPVLAPGGFAMTGVSGVVLTFVRLIATSVVYAWLLNSTRGSLLIVMLAHAGHNIAAQVVPLPGGTQQAAPVTALLYVAAAVIVVLFFGAKRLSRLSAYPPVPISP